MRRIMLAVLTLMVASGVAAADHRRGPVVRDHRSGGGVYVTRPSTTTYTRPTYTYSRPSYTYSRPSYTYSRPTVRYVRHPIYVQRPVIAYRYYNYYQRPALIVENYPPMTGYYWVAGHWDWNGYEWQWNPGHYEPDPSYNTGYDSSYDNSYYDNSTYDNSTYDNSTYYDGSY